MDKQSLESKLVGDRAMAVTSLAVANKFLELARESGYSLTNMQLQKLVFFAHGYHLALEDTPLYSEETKAWQFGPVIPNLYKHLQKYGRSEVSEPIPTDGEVSDEEQINVIGAVWDAYKGYDAWRLSDISHREGSPWEKVWSSAQFAEIDNDNVKQYYRKLLDRAG